jgi:hypothetical protein
MDDFAKGKPAERQPYFEETAARRASTTTAVEKDFWICWTLKHLFAVATYGRGGGDRKHYRAEFQGLGRNAGER